MKIPTGCKLCGRTVTVRALDRFAKACNLMRKDPEVAGSKGILCDPCFVGRVMNTEVPDTADLTRDQRARLCLGGKA